MSATTGINESIIGAQALSFYNDSKFIRVENSKTGVTTYFNKVDLVFQSDADTTFFLKSNSLQTYFLWEDVARPMSANVKALLEIFQKWIEESESEQDKSVLISDSTTTVLEVKTFYDKDYLRVAEMLVGAATTAHDEGQNAVEMSITDNTARAVRQSKSYATIINNKVMYAVVGATLISDKAARNVVSRVGCFDDDNDITFASALKSGNGIFFQYSSVDGLSLVLRSNITGAQVDTVVPQSQWDVDTLDGTGPTATVLDPAVENTFIFEWSALKGNVIRAGFMQDGYPVFCHKFMNVRMGCASIPLRWELGRLDPTSTDSDAASMTQAAASVMIQGNSDGPVITRSVTNNLIKPVTLSNSPQPIISLRLRPDTNRAKLVPRRIRLLNLDPGVAKWSLVINPSVLTGFTFTNIGNGSYGQFSESETTVSGGVVLASGFFSDANGQQVIDLSDKSLQLCSDISGHPDVLTVVVHYLRGVVAVSAAVEWGEME
jgi:hypothetical protein